MTDKSIRYALRQFYIVADNADGRWFLNVQGTWENMPENASKIYETFAYSIIEDDGVLGPDRARPFLVEVSQ